MRSFLRLQSVDPGFNPQGLLTLQLSLSGAKYEDNRQVTDFYRRLLERFEAVPGVLSAGAMSWLPLASGGGSATTFRPLDRPAPPPGKSRWRTFASWRATSFVRWGSPCCADAASNHATPPNPLGWW
jgi:hypothetical protein